MAGKIDYLSKNITPDISNSCKYFFFREWSMTFPLHERLIYVPVHMMSCVFDLFPHNWRISLSEGFYSAVEKYVSFLCSFVLWVKVMCGGNIRCIDRFITALILHVSKAVLSKTYDYFFYINLNWNGRFSFSFFGVISHIYIWIWKYSIWKKKNKYLKLDISFVTFYIFTVKWIASQFMI
jgi:hypothetical protein